MRICEPLLQLPLDELGRIPPSDLARGLKGWAAGRPSGYNPQGGRTLMRVMPAVHVCAHSTLGYVGIVVNCSHMNQLLHVAIDLRDDGHVLFLWVPLGCVLRVQPASAVLPPTQTTPATRPGLNYELAALRTRPVGDLWHALSVFTAQRLCLQVQQPPD